MKNTLILIVPCHKALARRKTGPAQESGQHQWSSHTDRHIAQPSRPSEDSRQDSVGVQSQKPVSGILDLTVAVSIGALVPLLAPNFYGAVSTAPMTQLPLVLIPT